MPSEILEAKNLTLMIGHSNYLTAQGGTEKIIVETVEDMLANDENSLFIYPQGKSPFLLYFKPKTFGLILNGFEIATIRRNELRSFTKQISGQTQKVTVFHWLFWPMWDLKKMLVVLKELKKPITIQINDFYFHCPKVNYFCLAGVKMCGKSFYKGLISWWRKEQNEFLGIADLVSVPSEFMLSFIPKELEKRQIVISPKLHTNNLQEKKKIAFLGAKSDIKGLQTWKALATNSLITRSYELYDIGSDLTDLKFVKSIPYSYKSSRASLAPELLKEHEINLVLLWSQVPESFSFTLHEALQANCFVITNHLSGNIHTTITKNPKCGIVLTSNYNLHKYLFKILISTKWT